MTAGYLLIDKPAGMTSHDAVNIVRKARKEKRVGHGGTLDPAATGLLIIGVGREATKRLGDVLALQKTYEATIRLGETSTTDDTEGTIKIISQSVPSLEEVEKTINGFHGESVQTPPVYSAIKVNGKRAYTLARQGKEISIKPRTITIHNITLLGYTYPDISVRTTVSSGTYIRALARDIGKTLKTGGYLTSLRRTSIGPFHVKDAVTLQNISNASLLPLFKTVD